MNWNVKGEIVFYLALFVNHAIVRANVAALLPGQKLRQHFSEQKDQRRHHDRRAEWQAAIGIEQAEAHITGNTPDTKPIEPWQQQWEYDQAKKNDGDPTNHDSGFQPDNQIAV